MEFAKVQGRWAIAIAALAALVVATAWQPAAAQDKPAAQEPPAKKADQPAQPQKADKMVQEKPAQDEGQKADTVVVPGKKAVVCPSRSAGSHVRSRGTTPEPTVQLKPGEVPAIKFDTPSYDFGRVKSGTEIEHDFWFTNTGTGPLEIVRAKPS